MKTGAEKTVLTACLFPVVFHIVAGLAPADPSSQPRIGVGENLFFVNKVELIQTGMTQQQVFQILQVRPDFAFQVGPVLVKCVYQDAGVVIWYARGRVDSLEYPSKGKRSR
jgi:hypothetical protein